MAEQLTFYGAPQSRAVTAFWMLEELSVPYEHRVLNLRTNEHKQPAYLTVNPMGKVPAIVHKGVAIAETAAICAYLADAFPQAGLAPAIGDPKRGPYLHWLFFGPSCFEPAMTDRMLKRPDAQASMLGWGGIEAAVGHVMDGVKRAAPWLLGERFSAADVVIGSGLIWATMAGALPDTPELSAYLGRLRERPALKRVFEQDAEQAKALEAAGAA